MSNRNIIIAPCGNKSNIFRTHWLKDAINRQFDLCLLFYHAEINNPELYQGVDYFFHLKDFKFTMIHKLLTKEAPHLLEQYDYFYFIDDDVAIETEDINNLFSLARVFNASIVQAALTHDSHDSWPILRQNLDCVLRYMGQIEVMAPLFSKQALQICLPSFIANRSSWGLDSVWSKMLGYPHNKIAVIDAVTMRHTSPVGGGELYTKLQIDPYTEWKQVTDTYNAIQNNFVELGRIQIVDGKKNRALYQFIKQQVKVKKILSHFLKGDMFSSFKSYLKNKRKDPTKPVTVKA